jgi:hypothetical protein
MERESRSKSATGGVSIPELKTTPHPTGCAVDLSTRGRSENELAVKLPCLVRNAGSISSGVS